MKPILALLLGTVLCGCVVVPAYEPGGSSSAKSATVCHKGKKTLVLPDDAVQAHLSHGDSYGSCR